MQDPTGSVTPAHYAEAFASWQDHSPVPPVTDTTLTVPLTSLDALGVVRRRLRAFLRTTACVGGRPTAEGVASDGLDVAVEKAVMVIDELASNALRHGSSPRSVHLCDDDGRWMVIVSDGAPDRRPTPASGRPAGMGGYGLYLVTDLSSAHGVHYEADRKLVWVCIDKPDCARLSAITPAATGPCPASRSLRGTSPRDLDRSTG